MSFNISFIYYKEQIILFINITSLLHYFYQYFITLQIFSHRKMSGKGDSIKVVVRVRPFKQNQINANQKLIIDMDGQTVYIKQIDQNQSVLSQKEFGFHRCYWSFDQTKGTRITNKQVFQDIGKEVLQNLYNGYNATIFAYGQTGSGKSCSVQGVPGIEPKGLLQLCLEDVFRRKQQNKSKGITTTIRVTYMQIYNQKLKNLLSKDVKNNEVQMKALTKTQVKYYAKSPDGKASTQLMPQLCQNYDAVQKLFYQGKSFRVVGATEMNKNSSRSHAIFTIYYSQKGGTKQLNCKYNIVDLAGSQRLDRTGATGDRAKQGTAINKSLSALGRVINILAENCTKGKQEYVPYRQSVLTQILAQSLGGNSKTFLIAALSPAAFNYDQTLSTLRFAQNASKISTQSKKNVQVKGSQKQLRAEIQKLRRQLEQAQKNQKVVQQAPQTIYMNNMQVIQIQDQNKVLFLENQIAKLKDVMKSKEQIEKQLQEQRKRKKQLQESRDQALKKAGLAIMSAGMQQQDTKSPYIINISEDPTVAGLLIYRLKEGQTQIGTSQIEQNNIKLNALGINKRHCSIIQQGKQFYIIPKPQAKVFVNGFQVTQKQQIKHLDRIVLGHANKFKLVIPGQKAPDELRSTTNNQDQYGQFLGDKLNNNSEQSKNIKTLIQNMEHNLSKNAFLRFLQLLKQVYNDVDAANQFTIQRYKKFPLRSRNLEFSFNFMINVKNEAEVVIICKHKQTEAVLFLWNLQKFRHRLTQMQEWFSQNKNPEKSYQQFDPWFDATDEFIRQKEKLAIMSLKQMRQFFSRKQDVIQQNIRAINKEQTQILNSLIPMFDQGISKAVLQDYCQQYCDYYFRQQEKYIDKNNLQKIENMRKDEQVHKKMIRWMQTITEDAKGRKDFDFCSTQITKFTQKKQKGKKGQEQTVVGGGNSKQLQSLKAENEQLKKRLQQASSGSGSGGSNANDKKLIQEQYAKIQQLSQQLKRRALEMKKLKN